MKFFNSIRFKISFLASLLFGIVAILILVYSGVKLKEQSVDGAINKIRFNSYKQRTSVKQYLDEFMSANKTLSYVLADYKNIDENLRKETFQNILKKTLKKNDNIMSAWVLWEPEVSFGLDENGDSVVFDDFFYRDKGEIKTYSLYNKRSSYERKYYNQARKALKETVTDLYYNSHLGQGYGEGIQVSTVVPIIVNDEFKGVVSFDIGLTHFREILDSVVYFKTGYSVLVTNTGNIVVHPKDEMIGVNLFEKNNRAVTKHNIVNNIKKGKIFNLYEENDFTGELEFIQITPFFIGQSNDAWSLLTIVPNREINEDVKHIVSITTLIGLIGLVLTIVIGWFVIGSMTKPLYVILKSIKELNPKYLDKLKLISGKMKNEIGEMAKLTYILIEWLDNTGKFAKALTEKKYREDYKPLNDDDILGRSLVFMRDYLDKSEVENKRREIENKQQIWNSEGFGHISEIVRQNNNSVEQMSSASIKYIVDYVEANQGGIYVINDEDKADVYYELLAAVAYGREKIVDSKIKIGEGLVGRCVFEKMPIVLTEIPQDYIKITSGLGASNPDSLLIVPIILEDRVFGVIELAFFGKIEDYKISFIEKISNVLASAISNNKVASETRILLEKAQAQGEMLSSQEEEMRQNMEEMRATQEEQGRLQQESDLREKELFAIIDNIKEGLLIVDRDGNIKIFNTTFSSIVQYEKYELIGKNIESLFGITILELLLKEKVKVLRKDGEYSVVRITSEIVDSANETYLLKINL